MIPRDTPGGEEKVQVYHNKYKKSKIYNIYITYPLEITNVASIDCGSS